MFWSLVGLAALGLAPAILLPEWRAYESLRRAEQYEQRRVAVLQSAVDQQRRELEALRTDPAVAMRLAQREIGWRPGQAQEVFVGPPHVDVSPESVFLPEPVNLPPLAAWASQRLPQLDYDAVFCDARTRPVIIVMSVALLCLALALYGRRSLTADAP